MKVLTASLVVLLAISAGAHDLKLISIEEEVSALDWVSFVGRVENVGDQILKYPGVILALKNEGRVITVQHSSLDTPTAHLLHPGEVGTFDILTTFERHEYDDVTVYFQGRPEGPLERLDPSYLTGDLQLLESSLTMVASYLLGDVSVLGEVTNGTNAVVGDVKIRFTFFDEEDNFLGTGQTYYNLLPNEVQPGETIAFQAYSEVAFADIARWEVAWEFVPRRLGEEEPSSSVQAASWGELKAGWLE